MPEQRKNRINSKHAATTNKTGLTANMPQQQTKQDQQQICLNNKQNRINSKHAATTNKTGSTTDMPQQQVKADQQQTCHNNKQNQIRKHYGEGALSQTQLCF
jgi:hypothetical protein